jgi:hypothetical protein
MSMFLTDDEVISLTGRKRRDAQVKALRYMGIEHRTRADGSVVVLAEHVNKILGGIPTTEKPLRDKVEPNWEALQRHAKAPLAKK